jgi:hypothetical protein
MLGRERAGCAADRLDEGRVFELSRVIELSRVSAGVVSLS